MMRALISLLALVLVSASPPPKAKEIAWAKGDDEAIVIPAGSPVHFAHYDKDHYARFTGRFVLTGTFVYGCDIECEPPLHQADVYASIVPDRAMAAVLPHWKLRNSDMRIYLDNGERLASQIVSKRERAALLAGKVDSVRKKVSIVVDDFRAGIECDSASYSARFVALAKPVQVATARLDGDYGCG
jgi:hypothetical protein